MDGILIVNKPQGMTSHDVVAFIRKRFGLKKVGHAGTLDPMATGVLVMLVGKSTKSSGQFMRDDKEYEAEMMLGAVSDTGDAWGDITPSGAVTDLKQNEIEAVFKRFLGEIEQTPPMYSAIKCKGKKLYELARKGVIVDVEPRKIFIDNLEILDISLPRIAFKVVCSKGTYIRSLAADIGRELGCGAYLSKLTRTRSGSFGIDQAIGVEELRVIGKEELEKKLLEVSAIHENNIRT